MSEPLQLKTELRTRIRGIECADYVVFLVHTQLPRLYTIRAERASAQKSARRQWHKGADRRRGGRGLVGWLLYKAHQSLRRRMKAKTVGKIHSRRQPTKQAKSAPWKDRHPAGQVEGVFSKKNVEKERKGLFVIKKGVFEQQS